MAFHDTPLIDYNSKASEESHNYVRSIFTNKNGFITREDIPDKGCDFFCELIYDDKNITNKRFPIQIKSKQNISIIDYKNDSFISIEFETSRLGYLCRYSPSYGLIVVYDDKSTKAYFDYVEEIYERVNQEKQNEAWKNQEKINIHIPISNVLNKNITSNIHKRFQTRFQNHEQLLACRGHEYGIPFFMSKENTLQFDFNNPKEIIEVIKKYGFDLLNNTQYDFLHRLSSQLTNQQILSDDDVLLVTAICKCEVGYAIDASFYLHNCESRLSDFDSYKKELIKFYRYKSDFLFGKRDFDEYLERIDALKTVTSNEVSSVLLDISKSQIEVYNHVTQKKSFNEIKDILLLTLNDIKALEDVDEEKKHLLTLYQAENINDLASSHLVDIAKKNRFKEHLKIPISIEKRKADYHELLELFKVVIDVIQDALLFSEKSKNQYIESYCSLIIGKNFLNSRSQAFLLELNVDQLEEQTYNEYKGIINRLSASYNGFNLVGRNYEAYLSLRTLHDIFLLFEICYDKIFDKELFTRVQNKIKEIQKKHGYQNQEPAVEILVNAKRKKQNPISKTESFLQLDENKIMYLAKGIIDASNIPDERLSNVIQDIRNYKLFYEKCKNRNLELLQDLRHLEKPETTYLHPVKYVIRSRVTGLETPPSSNVEELLKCFGSIISDQE